MDLGNHTIQSELRFSEGARSFKNPSLPGDILICPDPIHNFKSMRNHILDHGIVFQLEGRSVSLGLEDFQLVKDRQALLGEPTPCHKLRERHLNCEGHSRQNVLLVFQLLSRSVSNCLRILGEEDKGTVVGMINDFMDLCNSRRPFHWNPLECGFGLHLEEQQKCLERFRQLVETMRVNPPKPYQFRLKFVLFFRGNDAVFSVSFIISVCLSVRCGRARRGQHPAAGGWHQGGRGQWEPPATAQQETRHRGDPPQLQ